MLGHQLSDDLHDFLIGVDDMIRRISTRSNGRLISRQTIATLIKLHELKENIRSGTTKESE